MKILNKQSIIAVGSILSVAAVLFSCGKHEFLAEAFNPDRMFMPSSTIRATSGETSVSLVWGKPVNTAGTPSYTIEIAQDSLFDNGPLFELSSDTTGIVLTDQQIEVREKYFARVRTNNTNQSSNSEWLYSNGFTIRGKQLFLPINEQIDLKDTWVNLTWRPDETATTIRISKSGEGSQPVVQTITLSSGEIEEGIKRIEDLEPQTGYTAALLAGSVQIGIVSFTTKAPSNFTLEIGPDDDLAATILAATSQDVIGLLPGTYDISSGIVTLLKKTVTLGSVSGNPAETIILARGFDLRGDGAGIVLQDLTVDLLDVAGTYMIDLKGETSDGGSSVFTHIHVQGCVIQNIGRAFVRGSRAANRDHKIDYIKVENSILKNNDTDYALFEIQKLAMNNFEISNSTINRVSNNIIRYDTNIGTPAAEILFDHVTINAFGNAGRRALIDVNTPANIVISNSILSNSNWASGRYPSPTVHNELLRAANGATAQISYTNFSNLLNSATPPVALVVPSAVVTSGIYNETLPWTFQSESLELPSGSSLRSGSSSASAIGDPRWAQ